MSIQIRELTAQDEAAWRELWNQYLSFYEHDLPSEQTERTWIRLLEDTGPIYARVALIDNEIVGITHFSFTHSTWEPHPDIYLEDLYVASAARGLGVGRALINAVTEFAKASNASRVHWMTKHDNHTARKLYDEVATLSEFVLYERPVS